MLFCAWIRHSYIHHLLHSKKICWISTLHMSSGVDKYLQVMQGCERKRHTSSPPQTAASHTCRPGAQAAPSLVRNPPADVAQSMWELGLRHGITYTLVFRHGLEKQHIVYKHMACNMKTVHACAVWNYDSEMAQRVYQECVGEGTMAQRVYKGLVFAGDKEYISVEYMCTCKYIDLTTYIQPIISDATIKEKRIKW